MAERIGPGDPKNGKGKDTGVMTDRALAEIWRNAEPHVTEYPEGTVDIDGVKYKYRGGKRLTILGKQVMDTCEYPWSAAIVNLAFDKLMERHVDETPVVRVLEMGFGLGITANRILEQLEGRGLKGEYTVVELNSGVFKRAEDWKRRKEQEFKEKDREMAGSKPEIRITVIEGEAGQEAQRMVKEVGAGQRQRFDIIISDTYPLSPKDQGINDLKAVSFLKRLLDPRGVFAFYTYVPGANPTEDGLTAKQRSLVRPHFNRTISGTVKSLTGKDVNPPSDYRYLMLKGKPVRDLPVVVAIGPS